MHENQVKLCAAVDESGGLGEKRVRQRGGAPARHAAKPRPPHAAGVFIFLLHSAKHSSISCGLVFVCFCQALKSVEISSFFNSEGISARVCFRAGKGIDKGTNKGTDTHPSTPAHPCALRQATPAFLPRYFHPEKRLFNRLGYFNSGRYEKICTKKGHGRNVRISAIPPAPCDPDRVEVIYIV